MDRVAIRTWCFLSFAVSGFFIYHGFVLFSHEGLSTTQALHATSGTIYGIYSAGLLALTLQEAKPYHEKLAKYGVMTMLLTQIAFGLVNANTNINIAISLIVAFFMLSANWLAVKYVVMSKLYT